MQQSTNTPDRFKKYEREAKQRLIEHFKSDNLDFTKFMWDFAADVYNRGDGLFFMDFNERSQRSFLKTDYVGWIKSLAKEISDE